MTPAVLWRTQRILFFSRRAGQRGGGGGGGGYQLRVSSSRHPREQTSSSDDGGFHHHHRHRRVCTRVTGTATTTSSSRHDDNNDYNANTTTVHAVNGAMTTTTTAAGALRPSAAAPSDAAGTAERDDALPESLISFCEQNLRRAYDHAASERRRELSSIEASRITADAGGVHVARAHAHGRCAVVLGDCSYSCMYVSSIMLSYAANGDGRDVRLLFYFLNPKP